MQMDYLAGIAFLEERPTVVDASAQPFGTVLVTLVVCMGILHQKFTQSRRLGQRLVHGVPLLVSLHGQDAEQLFHLRAHGLDVGRERLVLLHLTQHVGHLVLLYVAIDLQSLDELVGAHQFGQQPRLLYAVPFLQHGIGIDGQDILAEATGQILTDHVALTAFHHGIRELRQLHRVIGHGE